jgi:hypothetical protein
MPLFDKVRSLFSRGTLESSPIVGVSATSGDALPSGFFISIGSDRVELGFYCPKCKYEVRHGAEYGVVHCGRRERAPDVAAREHLEKVRWDFPRSGEVRLPNGGRVIDPDEGGFNGEFEYEPFDPGAGGNWR